MKGERIESDEMRKEERRGRTMEGDGERVEEAKARLITELQLLSQVCLTLMGCFWFSRHNSGVEPSEADGELSVTEKVKIYKYKEIRQATDDFNALNKIGEGGFGSVYKGHLKDGKVAAIKVLSAESRQGVKEFLTEINVISEIQHENLVKLYGCCVEGNHRILVYNYLENNSLDKTLLAGGYTRSGLQFDWSTRANICVGVAKGLAFLHEEVQPHIIHRDIKASNIILDRDLSPKISDFGLARLMPPNMTHVSTCVAGTIWSNLVDIALGGVFDAEEACRYLRIGLLCTQDSPQLRPTMSIVVKLLTEEKDIDTKKITKPGLISDFMDMKVREPVETKTEEVNRCNYTNPSSYNVSPSSRTSDNSNGYSSGASSTNAVYSLSITN
ncbi:hypothetical protein HID58_036409 [Brassica napus]|uniref:Protein kinase domain-containing protein n=1 Tax=Brassica napus TaxID=3708 RepID=A0ABQ8C932_BRANA|nr:hypothetical protein HID58_036409 [Brassica napus]